MKRTKKLLSFFLAIMMVITTIPAFTLTASAATINEAAYNNAINAYVSKMNDSIVYYNMEAAYNAYIALKQSYDLCKYGGSNTMTADKVNNNITTLNNAVKNMTQWTGYNSFFKPTGAQMFAGDAASGIYGTNKNYENYYLNLLYATGPQNDINSGNNYQNNMKVYWNIPYAVALYNDNEIRIPVMCGMQNTANGARYLFTSWLNNASGEIDYGSNWMYRNPTGTKYFSYIVDNPTYNAVSKQQSNANNYYVTVPKNSTQFVANYFSIKPTSFTDNYKEFTSLDLKARGSNSTGHASNPNYGEGFNHLKASVGFYIIDYSPVPNNLTSAKTKIKNDGIANFDANNSAMRSYMEAVDNLVKIDTTIETIFPSNGSGVTKENCQGKAKDVASKIKSKVSELDTEYKRTTADSAKTTAYNTLRSAMDSARANYLLGADELKKTYTANSVKAFIDAYNNAKSIMSKVGPQVLGGENYGHDASDTNTTADALKKALLVEKADFSEYITAYNNIDKASYLKSFSNKDIVDVLPKYSDLSLYKSVKVYTNDEKDNTPKTEQSAVTSNAEALHAANRALGDYNALIKQEALIAFKNQKFDLDVVDNTNITTQKENADKLYKTVPFNGTNYYSLDVENQAELDSNIAGYINSINSTLGKYDIKVPENADIKVTAGGVERTADSIAEGFKTYSLTYGVPVIFTSTNEDTAWYMKYKSNVAQRGMQYQCSGGTYATKVMGNMTITPKARVNDTTPNKVTVVRQYSDGSSSAMLIDYVNGSYVLPTAQTYPNYTFTRYEVNGTPYNAGATVAITGDTVIYAKYEAANSNHQIIITDTNGTRTDSTYKYNSAVKLNDPNAYAWIEKPIGSGDTSWRPSYIGTGCSYKVTEPMELKAVKTEAEMKQYCGTKEAYAPNLRFNGPLVADGMGVVFHGQYINYVPANAEIVEYGVLVYKGNSNDFDLTSDKKNIIRCKSTNPMKSNQFSVGALYNQNFPEGSEISYKSYMIYQIKENGTVIETKYVYSDDVRHYPENA